MDFDVVLIKDILLVLLGAFTVWYIVRKRIMKQENKVDKDFRKQSVEQI